MHVYRLQNWKAVVCKTHSFSATQRYLPTGIEVELVAAPTTSFPRIEAVDNLRALPLLHTYAGSVGMSAEAVERGAQILKAISDPRSCISASFFENLLRSKKLPAGNRKWYNH